MKVLLLRRGDAVKVKEVMTRTIATCAPGTNLAEVGRLLWEKDCGILPVVRDRRLVGMITDRDVAIAAATKPQAAYEILVRDVISGEVHACHMDDDLEAALEIMSREQVRRLAVVDDDEALRGILSLNDLILCAGNGSGRNGAALSPEAVMDALKEVSLHRAGEPRALDAAEVSKRTLPLVLSRPQRARRLIRSRVQES